MFFLDAGFRRHDDSFWIVSQGVSRQMGCAQKGAMQCGAEQAIE
jgi:hypothetical protein